MDRLQHLARHAATHRAAALLLFVLCAAALAAGCRSPRSKAPAPVADKSPQRIVSLSPGVTEVLFLLDEERRLVGRTDHCNYPPEAAKIQSVGGFGQPSVERIVALRPDLIISSNYAIHPSFAKLKSLNMNIIDIDTETIDDVFSMILEIGALLNVEQKAKSKVADLRQQVQAIRDRHTHEVHAPRVYVEIDYNPIFTAGTKSFLNDMIGILGAKNIFDDVDQGYPQVGAEAVIVRDPEYIFLGHGTAGENALDRVKARPGWSTITATRLGRVYGDLNPDLYHRPSPRLVDGLVELEKRIYGTD